MIELKNIDKVYEDGFHALKNINLAFEDGKINVLIGPSGCGKTTTMKLLNRLVDYTEGQILFDGDDIKQMNPIELRRKIGFVIQNIGLFPHMTIYNNVATVPKLLKWDKAQIHRRVIELLDMVNLDPDTYMGRYPSELSGGQQQRIGVIRALAAEPSTILMDEPFSALDPISREQLQDELLRLQTEINKTIIFVTHDMDEALKIADQIILMKDGSVVQRGTPQDILENPANAFVKEFIGEKRLDKKELPKLEELISEEFVSISNNMSTDLAIEEMLKHQVSEIPVITENGEYRGMVSLFHALSHKDEHVENLIEQNVSPIKVEDNIEDVLIGMKNMEGTLPILSSDEKLVGILNQTKLFQTLHHVTEDQRGDKQWN